jgi:hypothetical protein
MRPFLAVALSFAVRRILPAVIFGWLVYALAVAIRLDSVAPLIGTLCGVWMFLELTKGGGR